MFAKIFKNAVVKYPYLWDDFVIDNNNSQYGFPAPTLLKAFSSSDMETQGYSVVEVTLNNKPNINEIAQTVTEATPVMIDNVWVQNWTVTDLSPKQILDRVTAKSAQIRIERDVRIAATDWQVLKALELGNPSDFNLAVYRQQLRDITAQTGFPWNIVWPAKPE